MAQHFQSPPSTYMFDFHFTDINNPTMMDGAVQNIPFFEIRNRSELRSQLDSIVLHSIDREHVSNEGKQKGRGDVAGD